MDFCPCSHANDMDYLWVQNWGPMFSWEQFLEIMDTYDYYAFKQITL